MPKLVVRHSIAESNNRKNYRTPLFGHPDARLVEEGKPLARELGHRLQVAHGVRPAETDVAVSHMRRAQETALEADFTRLVRYAVLNEIDAALPQEELRVMIDQQVHTEAALRAAQAILDNPPKERIWVSHGLVIAGLCEVLDITDTFEHFVPEFCEIRELPI